MKRAEYEIVQAWVRPLGFASPAGPESERGEPVATLWVPDPEQRRGWRERYVWPEEAKPNGKPIGFKR